MFVFSYLKDLYMFEILGALPMLFLTFKIPRSKRWLLLKGYKEEAKKSMQFVYKGNVEDEFERMAETIGSLCCRNDANVDDSTDDISTSSSVLYDNQEFGGDLNSKGEIRIGRVRTLADGLENTDDGIDSHEGGSMSSQSEEDLDDPKLTSKRYRPIMIIGLTLLVAQQASGQPSILAYSRVLFEAAGWKGHASVVTVLIMGVTSSMTVALVDRVGRKVLLLSGCAIMGTALLSLAVGFWNYDENYNKQSLSHWQQHLVLWGMFFFIAGYQVGYGPISWTVLSEIYPSEIRGTAMALSVEVNFFFKFVVQLAFPIFQEYLGWVCTFATFACMIVASSLFIYLKVPETKGMSLEEIQVQLRGQNQAPSSRKDKGGSSASGTPLLQETDASTPHALTPIV
jgi:hypothetical protein